jgi:ribosome-associated heat shock protein Hsp15
MSGPGRDAPESAGTQRLDKWLWFARVAKSRTLAATLVSGGKIRVNRARASKPSQLVKVGDVITAGTSRDVRVLRVKAPGLRRGPPAEAQTLYEELTPSPSRPRSSGRTAELGNGAAAEGHDQGSRIPGTGRPTKRDRRLTDLLKGRGP